VTAFEPIRAVPAFRLTAEVIEEKILSGTIAPGQALPSESKLAESLGVNRSTLREAIRALEQNGFVRREPGRKKLYASIPQSEDISRRQKAAMLLQQVTLEDLLETMYALEPETAAFAALRRSEEDLRALEANLEATRRASRDSASLTELDIEFHTLIANAARNRAIQMARLPISELFYPSFFAVMSRLNAGDRLIFAHEKIIEAVKAKDERDARNWMEKHIQDFRRGYDLANLDISAPVISVYAGKDG
jgi:DNA-binding FadR family transcriptional regulator